MDKHYDYLIVGAGLFGAVFARQAMDSGKTCLVVERRDHIGGNIYTAEVEGITVHRYGAHIFHTSDALQSLTILSTPRWRITRANSTICLSI